MQGVGWTELVKNQARRLSRIYLLESKTYQDLVLHCWHRTSSFHPTVPHATLACYPLFEGILQSNLATLVMHAEPAPLSAALSWWWLTSFISQVYAVLSILIPEALCISCYDCFLLSLFSSFLSMSASSFVSLLLTNCCFSSSCLSLGERTLQVACQTGGRWAGWERGYCWGEM